MKETEQIRIENFLLKLRQNKRDGRTQGHFAASINKHPSFVSNIVNGRSIIGEKLARELEPLLNEPKGWLDIDHAKDCGDYKALESAKIPVFAWATLGEWEKGRGDINYLATETMTLITMQCSEKTFATTVQDDMMMPRFQPGDVIVVDPDRKPTSGDYVLAKKDGAMTFKQLIIDGNERYLKPLNPVYSAMIRPLANAEIIGTAILRQQLDYLI